MSYDVCTNIYRQIYRNRTVRCEALCSTFLCVNCNVNRPQHMNFAINDLKIYCDFVWLTFCISYVFNSCFNIRCWWFARVNYGYLNGVIASSSSFECLSYIYIFTVYINISVWLLVFSANEAIAINPQGTARADRLIASERVNLIEFCAHSTCL